MRGKRGFYGLFLGLIGALFGAQLSFGAGFALFEGSARGNALGGAMVGRADDPSALFYNPAGITQLPGIQIMGGGTAIIPGMDVTTHNKGVSETVSTKDNIWTPPHFYATYQFTDRVWLGLGVFSPFGLGTEFSSDWAGRYNSYKAVIQSVTVNPNIAFKLNDQFSLAAGVEGMWFDMNLKQKIDPTQGQATNQALDVDQNLNGDSVGFGFNLAMHYKPFDWMALGASYRSQVKQHVEGDAEFSMGSAARAFVNGHLPAGSFTNTDVSGSIMLPDMLFLGVAFFPIEKLSVELGGVWNRWSNFDELAITFDKALVPGVTPNTIAHPKDWHDTWRAQVGVEYKAMSWMDLRAGYVFDEEPVDDAHADYLIPANDRHMLTFGPGFHWSNWTLDLSYGYLLIEDRSFKATAEQQAQGILDSDFHDGQAHLIGLSVGYKF